MRFFSSVKEINKISHLLCSTKKTSKHENRRQERKMKLGKNAFSGMEEGEKKIFILSLSLARSHTFTRSDILWKKWVTEIGKLKLFFLFYIEQRKKGRLIWIKSVLKLGKNAWFHLAISRYGNWETFLFPVIETEWNTRHFSLHSFITHNEGPCGRHFKVSINISCLRQESGHGKCDKCCEMESKWTRETSRKSIFSVTHSLTHT